MTNFAYQEIFPLAPDNTQYKKLTSDFVSRETLGGKSVLVVEGEGLALLAREAMHDIAHLLRSGHLEQLRSILDDPEASENDRFVALELLKNANVAAGMVLPSCQDTGTAIVIGKKGQNVWTTDNDEVSLSKGVFDTYTGTNLRYSQMAPVSMFEEVNTKNNLPAQIDLYATEGDAYKFLFMAKGGGSANKTFLYQATPAVLREDALLKFLDEKNRKGNSMTSASPSRPSVPDKDAPDWGNPAA